MQSSERIMFPKIFQPVSKGNMTGDDQTATVSCESVLIAADASLPNLTRAQSLENECVVDSFPSRGKSVTISKSVESTPNTSNESKRKRYREFRIKRSSKSTDSIKFLTENTVDVEPNYHERRRSRCAKLLKFLNADTLVKPSIPNQELQILKDKSQSRFPSIYESPLLCEYRQNLSSLNNLTEKVNRAPEVELSALEMQATDLRLQIKELSSQIQHAKSNPDILCMHPDCIAFAITLIEWSIFTKINPICDLLSHNPPPRPVLSVQVSTDFFNYLTKVIEHSILKNRHAYSRAQAIQSWIKIAKKLYRLRNFNSLKAVTCALSTPMIANLGKAWDFVSKKAVLIFEQMKTMMSEQDNYHNYREELNRNLLPCLPFLGVIIHDITYLSAAITRDSDSNCNSQRKINDIILSVKQIQTGNDYLSDAEMLECKHRDHHLTSFLRDVDECISEKSGYACDIIFCTHLLLTQPYFSDEGLFNFSIQTTKRNHNAAIPERSPSPSRINAVMSLLGETKWSLSRIKARESEHHEMEMDVKGLH